MPTIQALKHMANLLDGQIVEASRMLDILHQEYKAMASNDLAALGKVLEEKNQQAANVNSLERNLQTLGNIDGVLPSLKNFVRFIEQSGLAPLQTRWSKLQDILRQCQRQNLINHRIVEASRAHIRQALDILQGKISTPETYIASGKTQTDASGRFQAVA